MRWLHFIFSHSIFISFCAAGLCYQTTLLLHLPVEINVYLFVFFSTLCSYNFYWLLSKFHFNTNSDIFEFARKNLANVILALISACAIIILLISLPGIILYLLPGLLLTFLYSLPLWPFSFINKFAKAGFVKTTLLALTWTYVTLILPAYTSIQHVQVLSLLFIARFSFMMMLCSIFDYRDISIDKIHGLRSLATDVSRLSLKVIIWCMFFVFIGAGLLFRLLYSDISQLISFTLTGMAVLIVYIKSSKQRGYFFYYFVVDGLMLFSTASAYLVTII